MKKPLRISLPVCLLVSLLFTGCGQSAYREARATAQKNACINNLRQIQAAVQMFAIEQNVSETDPITEADWEGIQALLDQPLACPVGDLPYSRPSTFGSKPVCPNADTLPEHQLPE